MKKILSFLFIFVLFVSVFAETETCRGGYCFDCYDSSRGLPQNSVKAFGRDENGFMFVAGRNSFLRFDGRNFVFPLEEASENLPTSTINDFVIGSGGDAFLATDAGLLFFNVKDSGAKTVRNIDKIGEKSVESVTFDKNSDSLFGAVGGVGVFSLSKNSSVEWFSPEKSGLETKDVRKVFADKIGNIWLGAADGVYLLKKGEKKFRRIEYIEDYVSAFADFDGNSVFAGGKNGLYRIENGRFDRVWSAGDIQISEITALKNGSDGRLWIGTKNSGIAFFDGEYFTKIESTPTNSLKAITAFAEDGEGEMWFGTYFGGFCIAKKSALKDFVLGNEIIENVAADSLGNIWVNTLDSGIIRIFGGSEREVLPENHKRFSEIFVDSADNLWASSDDSGLYIRQPDSTFKPVKELFNSEEDLFPLSSNLFFEDSYGNVWTNDKGNPSSLFVFMTDRTVGKTILPVAGEEIVDILQHNGHFYIATKRSGVFERKSDGTIQPVTLWDKGIFVKKVFTDSKQRIWIITATDEIFINIEKDFVAFPLDGRFPSVLYSLVEDKNGNFWLTTNSGVLKFNSWSVDCLINGGCGSVPVSVYGKDRGLPFSECAEGRKSLPALSESGQLFVPMVVGLAVFDTDYDEKFTCSPDVRIEKIRVENEEESNYYSLTTDRIVLPKPAETVEIFYSAVCFSDSNAFLFEFSFDKNNFTAASGGSVRLKNLSSGTHTFTRRAYAANKREILSEKTVLFEVPAEFYQKTTFKLVLPIIFLLAVAVLFFMDRRLKIMRETEIRRLIDEKTAELQMKNNTLKEAVMKDPLTELMNRRFLFDVEERKIRRFIDSRDRKNHLLDNRISEKNDLVYGVIMMDIDHFKRVNDIYGHDVGDSVLKGVAEIMQDSVRVDDILIRWGGEEFLIVLKNIPVKKIIEVAKKIRKAIEIHPFKMQNGSDIWITASMGVVFLPFFATDPKLLTFENIITLADMALYHSKGDGRDAATFVVPGDKVPQNGEDVQGMLGSDEFAAVNGFYTFEKIEPDNFSEFEI